MSWQWNAYSLVLGLAATVSLVVAALAWRQRRQRGGVEFVLLMIGGVLWAGGASLQVAAPDLGRKLAFRAVTFAGTNVVAFALLAFAVVYTDRNRWITRRQLALLGLPALLLAVVAGPTNALGLHDLLWRDIGLGRAGSLLVLEFTYGPLDRVTTVYHYLLVLSSLSLFGLMGLYGHDWTRKQALALVGGTLLPFLVNVVFVSRVTRFDYTPAAFTVTGVVFALAVFRYGLLDLAPVARDAVLEDIEDGYVVVDAHDRIVDLNDTARAIAATPSPVGQPVAEALPEVAPVLADTGLDAELREEVTVEGDAVHHFEVRVDPLVRKQFRGRLLFLRDVTARRAVERRFRALIENASDLITVMDAEGRITYQSPAVESILGYDPQEMVGRDGFDLIHPEDRDRALDEFEALLDGRIDTATMECRVRDADGEWAWIEARAKNLLDDPAVEGVVANARDVTARRRRERELEQKNEQLDEFASVVSHDLRNPISILAGHVRMARETGDPEHYDAMERAIDRMQSLVDDLLELAREGEAVGETVPTSLAAVSRAAWETVDTDGATLVVDDDPEFEADPDRLRGLLENLFTNAVQHGGPAVEVRVGSVGDGFYVEDDGPGVPPPERETVFTRGVSGSPDGTGFGLAIVRRIADAHGWTVDLVDGADGGARFEFRVGSGA